MSRLESLMMNCEYALKLLPAYLDNELNVHETYGVEEHVDGCSSCSSERTTQHNFHILVGKDELRDAPPANLSQRIRQRIIQESSSQSRFRRCLARWTTWPALALAASVLLAVLGVGNLLTDSRQSIAPKYLMSDFMAAAVNDHIRQILLQPPFGLKTSNAGLAKAWLDRKLVTAVMVPNLEAQQISLVGARVSYLLDRMGAQLSYIRNGSRISFHAANGADLQLPRDNVHRFRDALFHVATMKGYQAVCWKKAGVAYTLVANAFEMNSDELMGLAYNAMSKSRTL